MDRGVGEIECLHAVGTLDPDQAIARAHVAKEEFAARADLENAREFPRRADVAQTRARTAAPRYFDVIDGKPIRARHVRAAVRHHSVEHEHRHGSPPMRRNGRLRRIYAETLNRRARMPRPRRIGVLRLGLLRHYTPAGDPSHYCAP